VGDQEVFTHLDITTVDDLVALDPDLHGHWLRAIERWARLQELPSHVQAERLRPWLNQIVDLSGADFEILVYAAIWFHENPSSGQTIRQVPVLGMHTKWLAHHRRLVVACLNLTDQGSAADMSESEDGELEQQVLDVLGLLALPVHIDLILADPQHRHRVGGLKHLRVPQPEAAALPIQPALVVIVENKESAYALPDIAGTVIVHSLGNHLNVLGEIGWIRGARNLYWGDLDRAGITMLSRARAMLPHVVSVLMDPATLKQHIALSVVDQSRADAPEPNLYPEELAALAALTTSGSEHLRLEQERIPQTFVLGRLAEAVGVLNLELGPTQST
jgi:hypothetical protein